MLRIKITCHLVCKAIDRASATRLPKYNPEEFSGDFPMVDTGGIVENISLVKH